MSGRRRALILAAAWFVLSAALLVAPLYDRLGNHVEPRVLGHPWSLVYVLGIVAINFAVLSVLHGARVLEAGEEEEDGR